MSTDNTANLLKVLSNFVDDANKNNSTTYKGEIFDQYVKKYTSYKDGDDIADINSNFLRMFQMIYDNQLKYNVTSKNILKYKSSKNKKKSNRRQLYR